MSVQFIRGTAVADLEAPLIQATKQWLEEDAQHEVFYLVPNHIKFEQEIQVLQKLRQLQTTTSDSITSTRLQVLVLSFGLVLFTTYTFYSADVLSDARDDFPQNFSRSRRRVKNFRGEINKPGFFSNYFSFIKKCAKAILRLRSFIHFRKTNGEP